MRFKHLRDQTIVVTGATSGNGLAIARAAVAQNARVVLVARNETALRTVRESFAAKASKVAICAVDIAGDDAADKIVRVAKETFGGFDSWVNNAGTGTFGTLEEVSIEDHRRVFDVNYFGLLNGSLAAARHLRARGGGAIINVGSMLSDRSILMQGPYCATKHAVKALTETLRMELEADRANISVTLVKPASIDTPFPEHARNYMGQPARLPPPLYHPDVVADAVLFACTHKRRQLYAGGFGPFGSLAAQLAPRTTDLMMELAGAPAQKKPGDPGKPERKDNLYESRADGAVRGSQRTYARRSSTVLQLQKVPPAALAGTAIAFGLFLQLGRRGRRR